VNQQGARKYRLFFALWPEPQIQKEMAQVLRRRPSISGRSVPRQNYHVTLAFLGDVEEERLSCLCEQAARVEFTPFSLELDQLGQFRRSSILWLGCSSVPDTLSQLYLELSQALVPCDYQPDTRAFRPHITLYRRYRARLPDTELRPITWPVNDFRLILSEPEASGVRYQCIATFPRLS
jgi:RNA 2',3'-cyclic 3'-phosphodiesterase